MSTLVIPDIHNRWQTAQRVVDAHPECGERVFLGDIYDDFNDTLAEIRDTAKWHKGALRDERNKFLYGNHDIWYAYPGIGELICSGNTRDKAIVINSIVMTGDWALTHLVTFQGPWMLSHAGVHPYFLDDLDWFNGPREDIKRRVLQLESQALEELKGGIVHPFLQAGVSRGGDYKVGGITWQDWVKDFKILPAQPQVVGHTPFKDPWTGKQAVRHRGGNWCIDTHLQHAAIIHDDGRLEVFEV